MFCSAAPSPVWDGCHVLYVYLGAFQTAYIQDALVRLLVDVIHRFYKHIKGFLEFSLNQNQFLLKGRCHATTRCECD